MHEQTIVVIYVSEFARPGGGGEPKTAVDGTVQVFVPVLRHLNSLDGSSGHVWLQVFWTLSWNRMCRASHIGWRPGWHADAHWDSARIRIYWKDRVTDTCARYRPKRGYNWIVERTHANANNPWHGLTFALERQCFQGCKTTSSRSTLHAHAGVTWIRSSCQWTIMICNIACDGLGTGRAMIQHIVACLRDWICKTPVRLQCRQVTNTWLQSCNYISRLVWARCREATPNHTCSGFNGVDFGLCPGFA